MDYRGAVDVGKENKGVWKNAMAKSRTSLVVQWLRLCLPIQGMWVCSLVRELRAHMSHGKKKRTKQYKNYIVTNSIKILKMVHTKKCYKKKKKRKKSTSLRAGYSTGGKIAENQRLSLYPKGIWNPNLSCFVSERTDQQFSELRNLCWSITFSLTFVHVFIYLKSIYQVLYKILKQPIFISTLF